jgi:hypothetical protein
MNYSEEPAPPCGRIEGVIEGVTVSHVPRRLSLHYHAAIALLALGVVYASSPHARAEAHTTKTIQATAGGCSGTLYAVDSFARIYAVNLSTGATSFFFGRTWTAPAYLPEGNAPIAYLQNNGLASGVFQRFIALDSDSPLAFRYLPMTYPATFNTSLGNAISSDGSNFYWVTRDTIYQAGVTNGSMEPVAALRGLSLSPDAVVSNVDDAGRIFIADRSFLFSFDTGTKSIVTVANMAGLIKVTDIIWRPCPRGGVRIAPTAGLITTEAGVTAGFTAVLTAAPTGNVTIGLTSSDLTEGTVSPAWVTFIPSNWNVSQNITVTGVNDGVVDGDQPYTIVTSNSTSSDSNYSNRFVQDVHLINVEQPGLTATTIHSSFDPSAAGAPVTFTATVIAALDTPGGSVEFWDGTSFLGNTTLSDGMATYTTSALGAGTHTITANYLGASPYLPSSANLSQEVKTATGHPTSTMLMSSANPSAPGAPVTLKATVKSGSGKNKPTGAVRFDDGDTTIGTVTLRQNDKAALVAAFTGGIHVLRATYLGTSSFDPSVSPDVLQTVGALPALAITSSLNSSTVGTAVTFMATITGTPGSPAPTGTISFMDGATLLQSSTVSSAPATYATTSSLTAGIHTITAVYSGDNVYAGASALVKQNVKVPHTK